MILLMLFMKTHKTGVDELKIRSLWNTGRYIPTYVHTHTAGLIVKRGEGQGPLEYHF